MNLNLYYGVLIKVKDNSEKLWSRDFVIVMLACSGISFCNYFFSSTLPIYAEKLTGTPVYAGLIMTVYTFAALAARPVTGFLSDRYGRVKLLVIGAGLCAAACLLYQYAAVIGVLILFRILHGIGFGIHSTSGGTAAADVIPKTRMAEGLGIFGLYGTIASALAPGIALGIIGDGSNKSFEKLFILAAVIAAACMVLDSMIRYEKKQPTVTDHTGDEKSPGSACEQQTLPRTFLGFERGVLAPAAVIILVFIGLSGITSFLTLFARERQMGNIGLFFTVSAVGMFLSRAFLGKVADRRGADIIVFPALLALIISFAVMPLVYQPLWIYVLGFPLGLAQGAICPAVNTMIFRRCTRQRRGSAAAAYFSSIDLGLGVGALLMGVIADRLGYGFVYWAAMVFALAAAVVYFLYLREKKAAKGYRS